MNKPMSAAAYRRNAEKVKQVTRPSEVVKLKSGSVFELRRPDLQAFMITGRLPQSLVREGMKAWKAGAAANKIAAEMGDGEIVDSLIFMREIVQDSIVRPKFVEFAKKDDEISAADMLIEDFNEIFAWAMGHQEVAGVDGLRSFRPRSKRRTAVPGINGKKQRR